MAIIPLYDEATYDRLRSISRAMISDWPDVAPIFVSVGPDPHVAKSLQPPLRILFVGQTAYENFPAPAASTPAGEKTDNRSLQGAQTLNAASVRAAAAQAELLPSNRLFWRATRTILAQALGAVGAGAWMNRLPEVAGWSNLTKVHLVQSGHHNPDPKIIRPQAEACVDALRTEILTARPTVTIFMSGNWAQEEVLFPALGRVWGQSAQQEDRVAVCEHAELGPLLWINHPTSLNFGKNGEQSEVLGFVAGYAAARSKYR